MADTSLELALKIRADLDQASRELTRLEGAIDKLGDTGAQTNRQLAATATSVQKTATASGAAAAGISRGRAQLDGMGVSAGQTAAAMRQLPAQITDITTSLASGSPVWMVAIQQGGQIKDSFGGIGPAARAVTGAISPMALGIGVGAAALGAIALAAFQAYQELQGYERALITSGNASGATSSQLAAVADEVGAISGRYGDAEKAVTALAASGKIGAETLDEATRAAAALAELTGQAIEDTTEQIIALAKAPTKQLKELNDQYNFLTPEIYAQVRALEDQGRAQDAARIAIEEFGRVHEQRVQEARERAGFLERAWIDVGDAIRGVFNDIKNIGRDLTPREEIGRINAQVSALEQARARLQGGGTLVGAKGEALYTNDAERALKIKEIEEQIVGLREERLKAIRTGIDEQFKADDAQAKAERNRYAIAAVDRAASAVAQDKEIGKKRALLELERDIAVLRMTGTTKVEGLSLEKYEALRRTQIDERFKDREKKAPKPKRTDGDRAEDSALRELENLRKQTALLGELEEGERKASEAARIRYEIEEGAFRTASATTQRSLLEAAKALDIERERMDVAKQLVDVKLRTMQLQGNGDEAALQATLDELGKLEKKLLAIGRAAEAADVAKLMRLETAQVQIKQAGDAIAAETERLAAAEQRVNISRENGLISSVEAQKQLLALRQEEIELLLQQIPALEASAAAMEAGSQAQLDLSARIEGLKNQLYDLQTQGTLLETTFRNTFEAGLGDALYGLATGTLTLKEAMVGLIQDVVQGMARLAAQQLASIATAKLMSALFKTGGQGADVGQGAAKLQGAAAATAVGGFLVSRGANDLRSAAGELAAAATLLIIANSTGGGFAEGGYTGPGGKYQLAGYVHKGEGVLNQQEIRALGGPSGFYALRHAIASGSLPRYANATPLSAATAPRFSFADGGFAAAGMPAPQVNFRSIVALDTQDITQHMVDSDTFAQGVLTVINRNGATVRQSVNN